MKTIAIFLIFVGSALSAPDPNGCIESCFNQRFAGLLGAAKNVDYAKPGNWSEHNQYVTDDGHGKVHEEQGQYQDASKQLRYFRKNYSSSYGSGDAEHLDKLATGLNGFAGDSVKQFDHSVHDAFQAHAQQFHTFMASQHKAIEEMRRLALASSASQHGSSARIEDLGHSENTLDQSVLNKNNGGSGYEKGFEEHGQSQLGSTHVKYYKKNYTSSYSSGVPVSSLGHHHDQGYQSSYGREADVAASQNSRLAVGSANYGHQASYDQQHVSAHESSKSVHEVPVTNVNSNYRGYYSNSDSLRGDQRGTDAVVQSTKGFQDAETVPVIYPGHVRKYEESHHSHHSTYKESTVPHIESASHQLARQQAQTYGSGYVPGYAYQSGYSHGSSYHGHGRNTYVGQENSAGHGFGSPSSGKLVAGMMDLGHTHNADCAHEESNQAQYSSQYMRKY